jgi:hypothetical protein
MAYQKFLHIVWVGTGTPQPDDLGYLEHWANLRRDHGWSVYLWTNNPALPWIRALDRGARRGSGSYVDVVDFTSQPIGTEMSRLVGANVWADLLAIVTDIEVLGEAVPFPTVMERTYDPNAFAAANLRNPKGKESANRDIQVPVAEDKIARRILSFAGWEGYDWQSARDDFGARRKTKMMGANYAAASDIVRVIALCLMGGFYTDISAAPLPQENLVGGLRGKVAGSAFNEIAAEASETTVLFNQKAGLVNNAFLGAKDPRLPFWIYFAKSMHKIYRDLIIAPDPGALTTYFTARAQAGGSGLRFNQRKLNARIELAGGASNFMYYMKRLAQRDLTLYCSGPYLLRACLYHYYLRNARSPLTVSDLCAYVQSNADAQRNTQMRALPNKPVTFEQQNLRVFKIQRGSWDQSPISEYYIDMFDEA